MVEHRKLRQNKARWEPGFEQGARQLGDDPYLVEQPKIDC
jgi:hypothetical protein